MNYQIDDAGLERASKKLGLRFPVHVRVLRNGLEGMAGKYHGLGRYGPTVDGVLEDPVHHISLNGCLGTKMANTAIWHELTHAMQCERFLPADPCDADELSQAANHGLAMAFRQEMKGIRLKNNAKSKKLTMDYVNVSFEVEAMASDKKFAQQDEIVALVEGDPDLLEDSNRYLWRVDLWKKGPWRPKEDREYEFVATHYVNADKKHKANEWARNQHNLTAANSFAVAYQIHREETPDAI